MELISESLLLLLRKGFDPFEVNTHLENKLYKSKDQIENIDANISKPNSTNSETKIEVKKNCMY